jgi:hypothetical protein
MTKDNYYKIDGYAEYVQMAHSSITGSGFSWITSLVGNS